MKFNYISPKRSQKIMNGIFIFSGVLTLSILIIILGYILINAVPILSFDFIFGQVIDAGKSGGISPMIVSSLYVTFISILIATPLGVGAAIYVTEYSKNGLLIRLIRFGAETLASIPSIVFGLFGLTFFVVFLNLGWSILSGGLVLAIMAIPTIFQVTEVSLSSVPSSYKEGSFGLGATKWQTICHVILPAAIPGIVTGIILGLTRSISEAAAVMYAVGSATTIPISMFDPGRPLPLHLYVLATEGVSLPNAYGTAAVLVIIVLIITFFTNYIVNRYQKKIMGN
ncbi:MULTISPECIES: phosphate ABC transporter permease PstA [Methanobrevibacter]|uniref:Phosphate transport system permease protein PstA n=1 Tax=Methanobrevibacter gottschalkii DSM 11977 TaxID=1122229 RepID=A0A3N5B128_9EURY|nr:MULTISPECIES: phosphate ABC transporter permease PstA [Methanobrevibacter]OEC94917.1 phosphate ABC transporter, permease protein PstA [Methanobrevibacter sp. A27]RPF50923.1 phosphate ABC transporter membrane protein 2 (PhoT family) [Methanobrevibacter gottschalkii DSM 11977]